MKMADGGWRMADWALWRGSVFAFLLMTAGALAEPVKPLRASAHVYRGLGGKEWADVLIGDRVAIPLRSWAGGLSPAARAEKVARRLNQLLMQGLRAEDVWVGKPGAEWVVYGFRQVVVTATFEDTWQTSVPGSSLAQEWLEGVVAALRTQSDIRKPSEGNAVPANTAPFAASSPEGS